jgi:hypothetical protein
MYVLFPAGSGGKGNVDAEFGATYGCAHSLREFIQEIAHVARTLLYPLFQEIHKRDSATVLKSSDSM